MRSRSRAVRGFTLIELLVVISIIGMLSSIVLASLNSARAKGYKAGALQSANGLLARIAECDLAGGKVTVPNSSTAPTNAFCSNGVGGAWPKPPSGWQWTQTVWIGAGSDDDRDNLIHMYSVTNSDQMHCGIYFEWVSSCAQGGAAAGLCKAATSYGCPYYNSATVSWE